MRRISLSLGALLCALAGCGPGSQTHERSLVVLAVDGMDPKLLRRFIAEGKTPNLARLAEQGGFVDLATSNPPQSPVAWSNFITGHDSSRHGIYDFLHRDLETMSPYLSTSKAEGPEMMVEIGSIAIPLMGGEVKLLRQGVPFWSELANKNIPTSILKIPANYPPVEDSPARVLSGMGTPDLLGTPGFFQVFTTDEALADAKVSGGTVRRVLMDGLVARAKLEGPPNPLKKEAEPLELPVLLEIDEAREQVLVKVGDRARILKEAEWTDWIPIDFPVSPVGPNIRGMVRIALLASQEDLTVYFSPINFDPEDPAQDISTPPELATDIARGAGRYYTQGMPEDTKALSSGVMTDAQFIDQMSLVLDEREAMLENALAQFKGGLLFFYFSSIDLGSHMFWRGLKPNASEENRKVAHVIPDLYQRIDGSVGEVMDSIPEDATLIVMSDHGFAPYDYQVNLNTWLEHRGYLVRADEPGEGALGHIDWDRTRAYALGLNQLYLNRIGREPNGTVPDSEVEWLLSEISHELETLRHEETGNWVVTRVYRPKPTTLHTPDMIVGFARGYRSSDDSALGEVGPKVVELNTGRWSGDHCMDPSHVPGVLLSNRKLGEGPFSLLDLAPSIRGYFLGGTGRSVFQE